MTRVGVGVGRNVCTGIGPRVGPGVDVGVIAVDEGKVGALKYRGRGPYKRVACCGKGCRSGRVGLRWRLCAAFASSCSRASGAW